MFSSRSRPVLVLLAALAVPGTALAAQPPNGPQGTDFYTPPARLPGKSHGDVIRARSLTGGNALQGARSNTLVLYRSVNRSGRPIAVSGTVSIPEGRPPKTGWPVVSFAHGTVGIADRCAPSRVSGGSADFANYYGYVQPMERSWLKRGWAVAQTDYEGLGTPGTHPYLNGPSEARSVLDMVRAARRLDGPLSRVVAIAGHSQGGQAALFAAAMAPRYTPELRVRGTVAFAPTSHLAEQLPVTKALTSPGGGLSAIVALIARGLSAANPGLDVKGLLSDQALRLYPSVDTTCWPKLAQTDSFGGLAPADLFREGADFSAVAKTLDAQADAETLRVPSPVRVVQGSADTLVFPVYTGQLVDALRTHGTRVDYITIPDANHGGSVLQGGADATAWLATRLAR